MTNLNTYAGAAAEVASLGLTFLNLDPGGHLMKLSQMQKIYCRFRFFNINHGPYLQSYFQSRSEKFDPETTRPVDEIQKMSKKIYKNMLRYRVAMDIFELSLLRVIIYSISWVLKLISFALISESIRTGKVGKAVCYFVQISQKLHMIASNSVALDLIPYTLRTLFHASEISTFMRITSAALLTLLVYDFCEIYQIGGNSLIVEFNSLKNEAHHVELNQSVVKKLIDDLPAKSPE